MNRARERCKGKGKSDPNQGFECKSSFLGETECFSYTIDNSPFKQCQANILPAFINNSMSWVDGQSIYNAFKSLSPPSIVVTSAGNNHPHNLLGPWKTKASKDFDLIVVGSLTPEGNRSKFSQQGEEVHIMAPSNYEQVSVDSKGNPRRFGGTSGAAPLVTGSLAGFEWLSGYHPTAKEAKILLERTAIPTHYSHDKPRKNGVGMVNAYKLGMVGEKLKTLCGGEDILCFKRKIRDPELYHFPEDQNLEETVEQAFPECNQTCGGVIESCAHKKLVFKDLRKAVFLNPYNKRLWRYLACIYDSGDFKRNSHGAINTYKALFGPPKNGQEAHNVCQSDVDCTLVPDCPYYGKKRERIFIKNVCDINISFDPKTGKTTRSSSCDKEAGPNIPSGVFMAMTKAEAENYYITRTCKKTNNEKCRYSNKEHREEAIYSSRCIGSQCFLKTLLTPKPKLYLPKDMPKGNQPSESSGQR